MSPSQSVVPPSTPHLWSLSPVFFFLKSPLSSLFLPQFRRSPTPYPTTASPTPHMMPPSQGVSLLIPPTSAHQIFLEFRSTHVIPLLTNASVAPIALRKNQSHSLALLVVLEVCLCLVSSSHPSHLNPAAERNPAPDRARRLPPLVLVRASSSSHLTPSMPSAGRHLDPPCPSAGPGVVI